MKDVQTGAAPVANLPAAASALVDGARKDALGALAATHARTARPLPAFHAISDPGHSLAEDSYLRLQAAAKVAAVEIHRALDRGDAAGALALCVDSLALARDASWGSGLLGSMIGVAIVGISRPGCAAAIDAAPLEEKRRAAGAIATIREGFRPMTDVVREDVMTLEIEAFAHHIPPARRDAFPEDVRKMIADRERRSGSSPGLNEKLWERLAWRQIQASRKDLFASYARPRGARDAEVDRVDRTSQSPGTGLSLLPDYRRYDDKRRGADAALGHLVLVAAADAYRAANGAWPSAADELVAKGFLRQAPVDLRTDAAISCAVENDAYVCPAEPQDLASRGEPRKTETRISVRAD